MNIISCLSHSFSRFRFNCNIYWATAYQLLIALLLLWLTRFGFAAYNASMVSVNGFGELLWLSLCGLRFDVTAVIYFNLLFITLRIMPFRFTRRKAYLRVTDYCYIIPNALMLLVNIADIPYFRFSGSRMRWNSLLELFSDSSIFSIIGSYFATYWWAFLLVPAVIALMVYLYYRARIVAAECRLWHRLVILVGACLLCVLGMRGRIGSGVPLNIGDAAWNIRTAPQINVVLNSPFCILRSINKKATLQRYDFFTDAQLDALRSSLHDGASAPYERKNVMLIVLESGSQLWLDSLNIVSIDAKRGIMPFLDSIASQSLVCRHTIATGVRSIEGISALLSGFPSFEPFVYMLSPYNSNILDAPATLLARDGYDTRFYYGCGRGSFNIDQMAHACGFARTFDRDTYGNDADYDGAWGIYDHAMAAYAVNDLSVSATTPFFATWFTVTAHLPFTTPDDWQADGYRYADDRPEHAIEYTDRALRHFFCLAKQQPWYTNTLFVITADHGCRDLKGIYDTPYIKHHIPFIVYAPDGSIPPEVIDDRVMSQFDLPATLLSLLGYDKSYVSIGTDLRDDTADHYGILCANNQYIVISTRYAVKLDGSTLAIDDVYDIAVDPTLANPLASYPAADIRHMQQWAKALLQDTNARLIDNRLSRP